MKLIGRTTGDAGLYRGAAKRACRRRASNHCGCLYESLKKHWRLESCATVEYSLGQWKPKLTYKDLEVSSPYNTYRHGGLPPGPIGNPAPPRSKPPHASRDKPT